MKKKILICLIFVIICFFSMNSVRASDFDADSCIDGFGSIYFGDAHDNSSSTFGKIKFSNKKSYASVRDYRNGSESNNFESWGTDLKRFDVEVTSKNGYTINEIIYKVSSKDGYSCSGVITGTDIQHSYVRLDVIINKTNAWVDDITFYASMKDNSIDEIKLTSKETVKVKYSNMTTTTFDNSESMTCQFLEDVFGEYWNWILILAPVATMILITIDFVGCILSSDAETMKKAGDKTLKRTIALVLLLMLPIVLKLIFNLFGLDICG